MSSEAQRLGDWHASQATAWRKAADTTAMDKPEPCRSSLHRLADWHDTQAELVRSLAQQADGGTAGEVDQFGRTPEMIRFQNDLDAGDDE
jgi:hypothetical protein